MKKRLLAILMVLAMMVSLMACGSSSKETEQADTPVQEAETVEETAEETAEEAADSKYDFNIGYTVLGNATNFYVAVNESLENACEQKGIDFNWTINDRDASKMKTAIDTYVNQGADIIVDFTVLVESGEAIAKELRAKGIPMLSIDCAYEGAYFFGVDNIGAGQTIGEFAADWVNKNWNGEIDSVQLLYNEAAGELVRKRVTGASEVLVNAGLVDEANVTHTNSNSSGATTTDVTYVRSLVVDYLTAHPNDDNIVIVCMTDEVATAANAAAISAGREDDVAIFSHNCDMAVVSMLQKEEGCIMGTLNYNATGYGEQITEVCATILEAEAKGEEIDTNFYNEVYVVNRDNAWEYYPEEVTE